MSLIRRNWLPRHVQQALTAIIFEISGHAISCAVGWCSYAMGHFFADLAAQPAKCFSSAPLALTPPSPRGRRSKTGSIAGPSPGSLLKKKGAKPAASPVSAKTPFTAAHRARPLPRPASGSTRGAVPSPGAGCAWTGASPAQKQRSGRWQSRRRRRSGWPRR